VDHKQQLIKSSVQLAEVKKTFNLDSASFPQVEVSNLLKGKNAKIAILLILFFTGTYAYLQYAKHLSRAQAAALISERFSLPVPVKYLVQYGRVNFGWDETTLNEYKALAKLNLIYCDEQQDYWGAKTYDIRITEEGKKYQLADSTNRSGANYYVLKVAERQLGEIKSIIEDDNSKNAEVIYTLKYNSLTPVAKAVLNLEKQNNNAPEEKTVQFFKSDNGWEIYGRKRANNDDLIN
jgi:hypothetical protein